MRRFVAAAAAVLAITTMSQPASAITRGGELDGDDHPYVGLMVADAETEEDGVQPSWRCSGALISPTVFVTAGHCTDGAESATIWLQSDLEPNPVGDFGYPFGDEAPWLPSGSDFSVDGTPHSHPGYTDGAFFLYDLGVVILDEPVLLDEYATLPSAGYVDGLRTGRRGDQVTAVGYGLQKVKTNSNPVLDAMVRADKTRYQADLMIVDTRGVAGIGSIPGSNSMVLSGDARHGGTCFGDSGGPILHGQTLVAVTSFGLNGECAGIGGVFRIDRDAELAFISGFLD